MILKSLIAEVLVLTIPDDSAYFDRVALISVGMTVL
jgi:hypothetical protein